MGFTIYQAAVVKKSRNPGIQLKIEGKTLGFNPNFQV
jgi:hypothetical protein